MVVGRFACSSRDDPQKAKGLDCEHSRSVGSEGAFTFHLQLNKRRQVQVRPVGLSDFCGSRDLVLP